MASVLLLLENLSEDKHVESILFPCLDEGSTPSSSTIIEKPDNESIVRFFFIIGFDSLMKQLFF